MENTNREAAFTDAPQHAEESTESNEFYTADYIAEDEEETSIYAMAANVDPNPDDDEDDDEDDEDDEDDNDETEDEDDDADWGHIDPAEGNSPFPDSNDPSGPGSAV
jgi:hypothetical protein